MYKEVISQKLEQLDYLYSVYMQLPAKAEVLAEMIEICRTVGIEVIEQEKWVELHVKALTAYAPGSTAETLAALNKLKTELIKKCIEKGLLKRFREIPVAGELEEEV